MDEWVSTILPAATTTGAISLGSIIGHFHNGHFELSTSCFLRQLMFGMKKTSTSRSIQTSTCEPCKKIFQADVKNLDKNEFVPRFIKFLKICAKVWPCRSSLARSFSPLLDFLSNSQLYLFCYTFSNCKFEVIWVWNVYIRLFVHQNVSKDCCKSLYVVILYWSTPYNIFKRKYCKYAYEQQKNIYHSTG